MIIDPPTLRDAAARAAQHKSAEAVYAAADDIEGRAAYWISIFQSDPATRASVKDASLASSAPADNALGHTLEMFETLTSSEQSEFIIFSGVVATSMAAGLREAADLRPYDTGGYSGIRFVP